MGDVLFQAFTLIWVFFIIVLMVYLIRFFKSKKQESQKITTLEKKLDRIIELLEKDKSE
ncbi:DUF4083 family protein [Cytobacillus massiliigabonensis]|uniref:DUF4083 family protein n=1 Tax=Cytobacillus massiliigabonensis TaxID=1871011 RepID=UPI003898F2EA